MRKSILAMLAGGAAFLGAGAVQAAELQTPVAPAVAQAEVGGWQFMVSPYLWAAGLSGNLAQFGARTIHVSPSFGDVLRNLDFAAMVIGEARHERLSLFADLMYTKLSIGSATPRGILAERVRVTSKTMAGLFGVGYAVLQDERGHLDLAVGVRAWKVSTDLSFSGGVLNGAASKDSASWVNAMAGVRGRYGLADNLFLTGWGMIGAGGARLDWDVAAGLGYQFNEHISAVAGYRALGVDYRDNGFVFDVVQRGPILGLAVRF
ncbi:MAG: DUF481 domain-containing protein [Reyranellaceae bacterium]